MIKNRPQTPGQPLKHQFDFSNDDDLAIANAKEMQNRKELHEWMEGLSTPK